MVKLKNNVGEKKCWTQCYLCVRGRERGCEKEMVSIRENKPELCCMTRGLEEKKIAVCDGPAAQCPRCKDRGVLYR